MRTKGILAVITVMFITGNVFAQSGSSGSIDLNGTTTGYPASGIFGQSTTTAKPNISFRLGDAVAASTFAIFNSANTRLLSIDGIGRVGIGVAAPAGDLHVVTTSTATTRGILLDQIFEGYGALITTRKARGTPAAPAAIGIIDPIGSFNGEGHDGTGWVQAGRMRFVTDGMVAPGIVPANFQIWTRDTAGTLAERMRISSGGWMGLGTTIPAAPLHINASRTKSQMYITDETTPTSGLLSALTYYNDNVSLGFDVFYAEGWVARNSTVAWVYKNGGKLTFGGSGGNTPNACCAGFNAWQEINLTNGTSTFRSSAVPNTSASISGGQITLLGYPTKVTFGNGQFMQDNGNANLRVYGGTSLQLDTSSGDVVIVPGSTQTRVTGNLSATSTMTIGTTTGDQTTRLIVHGSAVVDGNIAAKYQDLAEWVPATEAMAPGMVVTLNRERPNEVMPSHEAYDTAVAGVVSAQPGVLLGEAGPSKAMIATTGRVKVRVDASRAPIRIGDLLVASGRPGVAMRSEPVDVGGVKMHRPGTLIGKALEALPGGEGEVLVLLSLQ